MTIEKNDYYFGIQCFDTFALVTVALPTVLYLPITEKAGFDRHYEREWILEYVINVFEKDVGGLKKVFFFDK